MSKFTSIADKLVNEMGAVTPAIKSALAMKTALTGLGKAKKDAEQDPKDKLDPDERQLDGAMKKLTKMAAKKVRKAASALPLAASTKKKGKVVEAEGDEFVLKKGPDKNKKFKKHRLADDDKEFKPKKKVAEAEGDELAPAPAAAATPPAPDAADVPPPTETEPLTTEGEVFLVNLAKDCLNTDLETINLNDMGIDRALITQDVQPETAKEITKVLERIVGEEGIGETFNSKIDALIENFELSDLRSKLSIEDSKKNDRVVVLVPGSFKPPHKGHYEMVKQYSETYPQGQVQVIISAPSASSQRRTLHGKGPVITPAAAEEIFKEYIRVGGLSNVAVFVSPHPSPVTAAYETMERLSKDRPGITIILGASKKDNDWKRWKTAPDWADKNNLDLDIWSPEETAVNVCIDAECRPYSASNIRDNFNDWEKIKDDLPIGVDPKFVKNVFNSL